VQLLIGATLGLQGVADLLQLLVPRLAGQAVFV
jgi:hypothetical protein